MVKTFPFLLFFLFLFFVFHSSEVRSETQQRQHPKDSLSIQEKLSKQLRAEEETKFSFETEVLPSDKTDREQEEEELGVVKILHPVRDFTLREKSLKVVVSLDGSPVRELLPFPFVLKLQLISLNPQSSSSTNSSNLIPIIQTQTFTITEAACRKLRVGTSGRSVVFSRPFLLPHLGEYRIEAHILEFLKQPKTITTTTTTTTTTTPPSTQQQEQQQQLEEGNCNCTSTITTTTSTTTSSSYGSILYSSRSERIWRVSEDSNDMNVFWYWIRKNTDRFRGNDKIGFDETRRAAISLEEIEKDQVMIEIPRSLSVTICTALESPMAVFFGDQLMEEQSTDSVLTTFLVWCWLRSDLCSHYPYILSLPSPNTPPPLSWFMNDEELFWFEGTSVGEHLNSTANLGAEERRKQLVDGYFKKYFHWFADAPGGGVINSDRLVEWALSMVHTRQWTRQFYPRTDRVPFLRRHLLLYPPALKTPNDETSEDGADSTTAAGGGGCEFKHELNPLMDLLNHHNDAYYIWEEPTKITLAAHRHYYPGEEVYLSYGAKSTTEKFLWYGWLDDPNDVALDLSIETQLQPFFLQQQRHKFRFSSTLQVLREDLLYRLGSPMTYSFKATGFSKEDIGNLMESLCVLTLNEDDISQVLGLSLETVSEIINEEEQQQEGVLTRRDEMTESLLGVITNMESPNCLTDSNRERTLSFLHDFLISKSKSQPNEDGDEPSIGTVPSVSPIYFKNAANFFKRAERNIYHSLRQHLLESPPLYDNPPLSSYPDPIIDDVVIQT